MSAGAALAEQQGSDGVSQEIEIRILVEAPAGRCALAFADELDLYRSAALADP